MKPPKPPPSPPRSSGSAPVEKRARPRNPRRRARELGKTNAAFEAIAERAGAIGSRSPGARALELGNLGQDALARSSASPRAICFGTTWGFRRYLLPVVRDRPLVMRRFPNGIAGNAFYQQRAPEQVPRGVRSERVGRDDDVPARLVGGDLATLLHMVQLAVISQDPWFSRAQSPREMDFAAHRSRSRWPRRRSRGCATSRAGSTTSWRRWGFRAGSRPPGSRGLHIFLPLPPGHLVRVGDAVLPNRRFIRGPPAPGGGHRRADRQQARSQDGLRRLPAEHERQDAGLRLQRARQRLRRGVGPLAWDELETD